MKVTGPVSKRKLLKLESNKIAKMMKHNVESVDHLGHIMDITMTQNKSDRGSPIA